LVTFPSLVVRYEQASGTAGGSTSAGNNTVPLNTVALNTISGAGLSSNTLVGVPAGTYRFNARQASKGTVQLILRNVTDSTNIVVGENVSSGLSTGMSFCSGAFTLADVKTLSLVLWVSSGTATTGFGTATSSGNGEVYGTLELYKIG
jgi:hypothetical protein